MATVLPAEAAQWWQDAAGTTYEQTKPYGPLVAVYGPDDRLIERPYVRTWQQCRDLRPTTVGGGAS
jgi:hypothetical protein